MWEAIDAIASMFGAIMTSAGIWFVARQIRVGRNSLKAQFISQLETEIVSMYDTYSKLLPGEVWSSTEAGPESREEITKIVRFLGFFAKIKFLIDINAIDLSTIDRMFVFRFFLVVNNRHVQEKILYSTLYEDYWSEIFALHNEWAKLRVSRNLNIPFEETNLDLFDRERYSLLADKEKSRLLP